MQPQCVLKKCLNASEFFFKTLPAPNEQGHHEHLLCSQMVCAEPHLVMLRKKMEQEEEKAVIMELQQKAELQRILEQLPEKMLEDIITLMKERNVDMCHL